MVLNEYIERTVVDEKSFCKLAISSMLYLPYLFLMAMY